MADYRSAGDRISQPHTRDSGFVIAEGLARLPDDLSSANNIRSSRAVFCNNTSVSRTNLSVGQVSPVLLLLEC